ncbi:MAG: GFA family protein [Pseudomonadota bacterium]
MPNSFEGGCHCGAVRYTCEAKPQMAFYCHCVDCQRMSGSAFTVELMVNRASFSCSGELTAYAFEGESGPVTRFHCATCGSSIYLEAESDQTHLFVKAGSLDDPSWVRPAMHIFTKAHQPWLQINDDLPRYSALPEG